MGFYIQIISYVVCMYCFPKPVNVWQFDKIDLFAAMSIQFIKGTRRESRKMKWSPAWFIWKSKFIMFIPINKKINGVPACANHQLLTEILRNEWGFKGYVVSDDGAISRIKDSHQYVSNWTQVTAVAIKAGCNLELGSVVYNNSKQAILEGLITGKM